MRTCTTLATAGLIAAGAMIGWFAPSRLASDVPAHHKQPAAAAQAGQADGKVLPIPEPSREPITEFDARNAKAPPRFEVKPPKGAPNVVIVLIDDIGFGASSAFGGPIH